MQGGEGYLDRGRTICEYDAALIANTFSGVTVDVQQHLGAPSSCHCVCVCAGVCVCVCVPSSCCPPYLYTKLVHCGRCGVVIEVCIVEIVVTRVLEALLHSRSAVALETHAIHLHHAPVVARKHALTSSRHTAMHKPTIDKRSRSHVT
jgi:hypothetical protein